MSAMELALDDIISQTKKGRGGGARRGGARRGGGGGAGGRRTGGAGGRAAGGAMFTKSVPSGRWKHDKFNEIYGGAGGGAGRRSAGGAGGRRRSGGNDGRGLSARFARASGGAAAGGGRGNDIVKLNISNLAETVVTADLEELFEAYKVLGVTVHYDEGGNHLGTADVFLTRRTAQEVIKDFTGVAIDGREMKIFVVDENNVAGAIPKRVSVAERLARTRSNPIRKRVVQRRSGGGPAGGARRGGAGGGGVSGAGRRRGGGAGVAGKPKAQPKQTKLSAEELDRELESYMGSNKHKRISID